MVFLPCVGRACRIDLPVFRCIRGTCDRKVQEGIIAVYAVDIVVYRRVCRRMGISGSVFLVFADGFSVSCIKVLVIRFFSALQIILSVRLCLREYHKVIPGRYRLETITVRLALVPFTDNLCHTRVFIRGCSTKPDLCCFYNRIPAHEISCIGRGRIRREQACSLIAHP